MVCCDFRGLNANTIRDAYLLPRIDEALELLRDQHCSQHSIYPMDFYNVRLRIKI